MSVSGAKPPTRFDHATCCVAGPLTGQHHAVVMVVGGYAGRVLSDIWLLDLAKEEWSEVSISLPIARNLSASRQTCLHLLEDIQQTLEECTHATGRPMWKVTL